MISTKIQNGLKGNAKIPGDKSISHRAIIITSISRGISEISNLLKSEDVMHTINAFKNMGVEINENNEKYIVKGKGLNGLKKPKQEIYLGNSGTSARLLIGLLASQSFDSVVTGDKSLSKRPMERISKPLEKMNANIRTTNGKLPVFIKGTDLVKNQIEVKIPSAQIKSGLIFAALNTNGVTKIVEYNNTRDHTEIMLEAFGAEIKTIKDKEKKIININGRKELKSKDIVVPSDLSSSAFFIVAALINEHSSITLKNININPTRNGLLIALKKMGAKISFFNERMNNNEKVCDIKVESSILNGCELDASFPKFMIDEYPIISIAAAFANSPSIFRGLSELRVKESNRLELIRLNLSKCGVDCKVDGDDLFINPTQKFKNNSIIETDFDHRIAMSFAVMGSKIGPLEIDEAESIKTSFPNFIQEFNSIGGNIY